MAEKVPRRLRRRRRKEEPVDDYYSRGLNPEPEMDFKDVFEHDKKAEEQMGEEIFKQISKEDLERPEAMAIAVGEVSEFKERHKRLPKREEYNQIADNIFDQLKSQMQGTGRAREKHGRQKPEKESGVSKGPGKPVASDIQNLEIKDILSEDAEGSAGTDEFSLSGLETGKEEKKCPNCSQPAEEVLFCPECGSAFCSKCAKTETIGTEKKIMCPKCSKAIS